MAKESWLGIVGNGTTGAYGIEAGIHLRWQFRPEMGFPRGGFQLYRRLNSAGPKPLCFSLQQTATASVPAEILAGNEKVALRLLNGTIKVAERQLASPRITRQASSSSRFRRPQRAGRSRCSSCLPPASHKA